MEEKLHILPVQPPQQGPQSDEDAVPETQTEPRSDEQENREPQTWQTDPDTEPDARSSVLGQDDSRFEDQGEYISFVSMHGVGTIPVPMAEPGPTAEEPGTDAAEDTENRIDARRQLKEKRVLRLNEARRKRNAKRLGRFGLFAAGIVVCALLVTMLFTRGISSAGNAMENLRISLSPGGGWPARTNISEIYSLSEMGGGFVELGAEDLLIYSNTGNRLRSIQHGFSRPAMAVGDSRLCLYARAGTELRIESRTKTINTKTTENPILLCAMAPNGTLAVATRSERYAAEISIYNTNMEFIYGWNPGESFGTPQAVAFTDNGHRLAVACLLSKDGLPAAQITFLEVGNDKVLSTTQSFSGVVLRMYWLDRGKLAVVTTDGYAIYNASNGKQQAAVTFDSAVMAISHEEDITAVLLESDPTRKNRRVLMLDEKANAAADIPVDITTTGITLTPNQLFALEEQSVSAYDMQGEWLWRQETASRPKAVLQADRLLLFSGITADELKQPKTVAEKVTPTPTP